MKIKTDIGNKRLGVERVYSASKSEEWCQHVKEYDTNLKTMSVEGGSRERDWWRSDFLSVASANSVQMELPME